MTEEMKREWSLGYIIEHWVRVLAIAALILTGSFIHWPFFAGGPGGTVMAWMRFTHFLAAYALILGLVVRVYLAFCSTFAADWKDFGLIRNLKNLPDIAGYYLFIKGTHKDYPRYNPLQALSYLAVALVLVLSFLTGGSLYHGNLFGFIKAPESFLWVSAFLGGESMARIVHILCMWYVIVFVMIHVYMGVITTLTRRDRTLTSIITGYRLKKTV